MNQRHRVVLTILGLMTAAILGACGQYLPTGTANSSGSSESAESGEDVTNAEEELQNVEKEIAREEGRLESLRQQVADLAQQTREWTVNTTESVTPTLGEWSNKTQQEWAELNQWEYKTEIASATDTSLEDLLNNAGSEGWELVSIAEVDGETVIVYKRRPESFFKNIPARDLFRLFLLFGGGGGA